METRIFYICSFETLVEVVSILNLPNSEKELPSFVYRGGDRISDEEQEIYYIDDKEIA